MERGLCPRVVFVALLLMVAVAASLWAAPGPGHALASSTRQFAPEDNTYLNCWEPNRPQYGKSWLMLREDNCLRPVLKFDVSSINGTTIGSAWLWLYVPVVNDTSNQKLPCQFAAYCVLKDWNEATVTWKNPGTPPAAKARATVAACTVER